MISNASTLNKDFETCFDWDVCAVHLVAIPRGYKEDVIMCVRKLDTVRGHRLAESLWIDEGCGDEVKAGIQMLLAARSQTDQ